MAVHIIFCPVLQGQLLRWEVRIRVMSEGG